MAAAFAILTGLSIFCSVIAFSSVLEARRHRIAKRLSRDLTFVSRVKPKRRENVEEAVFSIVLWVSIGILGGVFLKLPVSIIAFLGFGAVFVPYFLANRRHKKREQNLEKQLEGALLDMTAVLWTNPSLKEAIMAARDGAQDPLRGELGEVLWEIDCGESIDRALTSWAARHRSGVLKMAVSAVIVCQETGGNLAQVLERAASLIRMRVLLKNEITALTSQQKTTAVAVSLMPIGFLLFTQILNPGYLNYLFTPVGTLLLVYAAISVCVGFFVLQKMSDLLPRGE